MKVLLISTKLFQYRINIYNFFNEKLKEVGIEFYVLTNEVQGDIKVEVKFDYAVVPSVKYIGHLRRINPDVVVTFLHLRDIVIWPLVHYLKIKQIPFVYWGHGVNLQDPDNKIKNLFFNYIHNLSDSILLYTPDQVKYIKEKNQSKIFIANNTLNFEHFPVITMTKQELRSKMGVHFSKILLFVSRILPYKKVDVLIDIFEQINNDNLNNSFGLLIVGEGLPKDLQQKVKELSNVLYLGPIYDSVEISEIFKMSDVFSIPGANGLSINQAMYWGLPCLTLNVLQGPEVWYIKQDRTGYVVADNMELKEKILYLFENEKKLTEMSNNCYHLMMEDGNVVKMYQGFYESITSVVE